MLKLCNKKAKGLVQRHGPRKKLLDFGGNPDHVGHNSLYQP